MLCIYCSHDTKVTNSRQKNGGYEIWRRRQCLSCGQLFSSFERPYLSNSLLVEKRSENMEPFVETKLLLSLVKCLVTEQDSLLIAEKMTKSILARCLTIKHNGVIKTKDISDLVKKGLSDSYPRAFALYNAHSSMS
jgi:transcriptional repressor NrdR